MGNADPPKPTDAELSILRVLWDLGPSTVRQVHEALNAERRTGYTTALKFMQIMTEKCLVERDESQRSHIYHASVTEEQTQQQLVGDLLTKAFDGAAGKLVMQALATKRASAEELADIRRVLEEMESGTRK